MLSITLGTAGLPPGILRTSNNAVRDFAFTTIVPKPGMQLIGMVESENRSSDIYR